MILNIFYRCTKNKMWATYFMTFGSFRKKEGSKNGKRNNRNDNFSVTKQWWLKVNRKSVRIHGMDGADFPYIIKIKYTIEGKDYICRKCIGAGKKIPDKGATLKVIYREDRPSKVRIEL